MSTSFWTVLASILEGPGVDFGTQDGPKTFPKRLRHGLSRVQDSPRSFRDAPNRLQDAKSLPRPENSQKRIQEQILSRADPKPETSQRSPRKLLPNHKSADTKIWGGGTPPKGVFKPLISLFFFFLLSLL